MLICECGSFWCIVFLSSSFLLLIPLLLNNDVRKLDWITRERERERETKREREKERERERERENCAYCGGGFFHLTCQRNQHTPIVLVPQPSPVMRGKQHVAKKEKMQDQGGGRGCKSGVVSAIKCFS